MPRVRRGVSRFSEGAKMRSRNPLESPKELLTSRNILSGAEGSERPATTPAPLRGIFGNDTILLAICVTLIFIAASLFAIAYINSDGRVGPLSDPGSDKLTMAAWIFGWITVIAGMVYLALVLNVRAMRAEDMEEALFKVEARSLDIDPDVPRQVEVIKVRCRYCGTLNDVGASSCRACGAVL